MRTHSPGFRISSGLRSLYCESIAKSTFKLFAMARKLVFSSATSYGSNAGRSPGSSLSSGIMIMESIQIGTTRLWLIDLITFAVVLFLLARNWILSPEATLCMMNLSWTPITTPSVCGSRVTSGVGVLVGAAVLLGAD